MGLSLLDLPAGLKISQLPVADVHGLYVHVPFCFHKCHYCDFYSITRQSPERMASFVDRILAEADLWTGRGDGIETVFFGGGTPSLLPQAEMIRLIGGLEKRLGFRNLREFTIECNPATVDRPYLAALRAAGVDRLSFGAQSFNPADLKMLERHHDPEDVPRSIEAARTAGFSRLNLDLIYGVPGQTLASWDTSLQAAISLATGHISAYLLTYEPNTPMGVKKKLGQLTPVEEDLEVEMMAHTRRTLRAAGIEPYEISNYTGPGQACRHNEMYWRGGSYIGLGPSAASHVAGVRWRNRPHIGDWETAIDTATLPAFEVERLPPDRRAAELAYLRIRTTPGIEWDAFTIATGADARTLFSDALPRLAALGLIEMDAFGARLTEKGVPLADAVASEFL